MRLAQIYKRAIQYSAGTVIVAAAKLGSGRENFWVFLQKMFEAFIFCNSNPIDVLLLLKPTIYPIKNM